MAFVPVTPQSQKANARPIAFVLDDRARNDPPITLNLFIRPEDLTRTDPSRVTVQQTLGGGWVDSFGAGLPSITIAGHTGWRQATSSIEQNRSKDGIERFQELKLQVFDEWHARRKRAVESGQDPDLVKLIFADALDHFAVVVVPGAFTLRRSKSRPLLCQYNIAMTVIDQSIDPSRYVTYGFGDDVDALEAAGIDSLLASIDEIITYAEDIQKYVDQTLAAPVRAFMGQTQRLYNKVVEAVDSVDGVSSSLINVAKMSARAGVNIFRTVGVIMGAPGYVTARMMQVASAYSNIFCVLSNALSEKALYDDYDPIYGASNCSSTSGGRAASALAGVNPFYTVVSQSAASYPLAMTSDAQASIAALAGADVVLAPMTSSTLQYHLANISSGLEVSA